MVIIIATVYVIIFTISLAYINVWRFKEKKESNQQISNKWHRWQAVLQIASSIYIGVTSHWSVGIFFLSFFWFFFDGILNIKAHKASWFWTGTLKDSDSFSIDKILMKMPLWLVGLIKTVFLLGSIGLMVYCGMEQG